MDTIEKDGKLFYKFKVLRAGQLRSSIIQNDIKNIGKFSQHTREINLNGDRKRTWLGTIKNINDNICNESLPISSNFFNIF
ncbi:MAG: hypothetical protein IIA82_08145 [Thaumarchaeota archaeon]|nr:hypothetical protein [Nitrososphaerota archaeon]